MNVSTIKVDGARLEELRQLVADVLERDASEISDTGDFQREYDADSMRAIEILSRLDKKYRIEIAQSQLPEMRNLLAVYAIVTRVAGWSHEQ